MIIQKGELASGVDGRRRRQWIGSGVPTAYGQAPLPSEQRVGEMRDAGLWEAEGRGMIVGRLGVGGTFIWPLAPAPSETQG